MVFEKKNFKRGQIVKLDKEDRFGKKWTEKTKVVAIYNNTMLLENGDSVYVF